MMTGHPNSRASIIPFRVIAKGDDLHSGFAGGMALGLTIPQLLDLKALHI